MLAAGGLALLAADPLRRISPGGAGGQLTKRLDDQVI
jgi:hypothetical protein